MENVDIPLYGTSNQTGETKLMKPNKKYKFKDTSSVTEMPAYQSGGKLQFLGRERAQDPSKWRGPDNASGVFGLTNSFHTPEQINMGTNTTPATDMTPYMLVQDDMYYNPYDNVITQRRKDGTYHPIELSRRSTQTRKSRQEASDPNAPFARDGYDRAYSRILTTNPNAPYISRNKDKVTIEDIDGRKFVLDTAAHMKQYPKPQANSLANGGALDSILGAVQGIGPALGPIGMAASGVATLAPLVIDLFSGKDKTVVSASPGKYADGGEIHINPKNKGKFTAAAKRAGHGVQEHARAVLADPSATPLQKKRANFARNAAKWNHQMGGELTTSPAPISTTYVAPPPLQQVDNAAAFRQYMMQTLNSIGDLRAQHKDAEANQLSNKMWQDYTSKKGQYQTGGDVALSSGAFQVQGNPNVTDGNSYPEFNANLDHNEVVTTTADQQKFVYSTDLRNPVTGKAYSEEAAVYEKAKGKAEKRLQVSPYDEQAKSTIAQSNRLLDDLANNQEAVATAMGHRNADGSTKQEYRSGGRMNNYQTAGSMYTDRLPRPNSYLWDQEQQVGSMDSLRANTFGAIPTVPYVPFVPQQTPQQSPQSIPQQSPVTSAPKPAPPKKTSRAAAPSTGDPLGASIENYSSAEGPYGDPTREALRNMLPFTTIPSMRNPMADQLYSQNEKFNVVSNQRVPNLPVNSAIEEPTATASMTPYNTPWTAGDYLKLVQLGGSAAGLLGGPEKEIARVDNTQLTQETYDPTALLHANQRSFNNYRNALGASTPINLRRGLLGSALSSQMNQQNNVMSQYNRMNQEARSSYQDRVSNQRRFNAYQQAQTDNINAANRGAHRNAVQNMFTSIGQFGEDLNRKRQARDSMRMLQGMYPEIFKSVVG